MTPHFLNISDITNSSSFNGKICRKKSVLENFRANILKRKRPLQILTGKSHQNSLYFSSYAILDKERFSKTIMVLSQELNFYDFFPLQPGSHFIKHTILGSRGVIRHTCETCFQIRIYSAKTSAQRVQGAVQMQPSLLNL